MNAPNSKAPVILERLQTGDYLGIAEVIVANERLCSEIGENSLNWDSRVVNHFTTPLALEDVWYMGKPGRADFKIHRASFHIFGDDETEVTVNTINQDFIRSDDLSLETMERFTEVYTLHSHLVCLKALRHKRLEELAAIEKRRVQQEAQARKGFRVTINGIAQEAS